MIGQTLSHYRILERLGEGGMGTVYRALDLRLERPVAIKLLRADAVSDPERKLRFIREAKAASALNHPNIVTIYEIDNSGGVDFIAMEYIQGQTLDRLLAGGPLPPSDVLRHAIQIAAALEVAHAANIVHRDLKPANIMINDQRLVKILDFGLAKLIEVSSSDDQAPTKTIEPGHTQEGAILGTVAYMSPEQAEGKKLDGRSDIFSFGSVLYEMLAGRRAFQGSSNLATMAAVLREEPRSLREAAPGVSADLERIVKRCLRKDPGRRFQHMADLRVALKEASDELSAPRDTAPSIAVLPFADMSPQKDQDYFCEGIAEEIINALAKVEGLRVAARSSAFQFKGRSEDVGKIGAQLRVSMILEGSVRKAGDRLRVIAQLVNVTDGYHVWSERYDREMKDIFAIQDEIALAAVDALRLKLLGGPGRELVRRPTDNLEAYDLYLRGRYAWNTWSEEGIKTAAEYFNGAIEKDPRFGAAYGALAECYGMAVYWCGWAVDYWQKARMAARRALEINDGLAEAHTALGMIASFYDCDWAGAERNFRRAIDLNPSYFNAHIWYATLLATLGRPDQAISEAKRGLELEPRAIAAHGTLIASCYWGRLYDQAVEYAHKAIALQADHHRLYYYLARTYVAKNLFDQAVAMLEKGVGSSGGDRRFLAIVGYAYARMGKAGEAEKILADFKASLGPAQHAAWGIAVIYAGLGEKEQALQWLENSYRQQPNQLRWIKVDPLFDGLRADPGFVALLEKMGLG